MFERTRGFESHSPRHIRVFFTKLYRETTDALELETTEKKPMARTTANPDIDNSQTKNETQETQDKLVKQRTSYALSPELEEKISSLTQGHKPYQKNVS